MPSELKHDTVKKILTKMLLPFALLGLAACTNDGLQGGASGNGDGTVQFLSLSLTATDATNLGAAAPRTDDDAASDPYGGDEAETPDGKFNPGRPDEQAVSSDPDAHTVLLFSADDGFYGSAALAPTIDKKIYLAAVTLRGKDLPAKLLAVVNAGPERIAELVTALRTPASWPKGCKTALQAAMQWVAAEKPGDSPAFWTGKDGKDYFTMSSSVYGLSGKRIAAAAPSDASSLEAYIFESPEEAFASPLTIPVERVFAKFTVAFPGADGKAVYLSGGKPVFLLPTNGTKFQYINDWRADEDEDPDGNDPYQVREGAWKVHVVNWGINAVEPGAFLFKNLTNEPGGAVADASFSGLSWWNTSDAAARPRSYWAVDQHYAGGNTAVFGTGRKSNRYPQQFRIAYDAAGTVSYESDETRRDRTDGSWYDADGWALDYYSYNDIRTRAVSKYAVENTFDPAALQDALAADGHLRVGSHILLATQLVIEGFDAGWDDGELDENNLLTGVRTKYYNGAEFMAEPAMLKWSVYTMSAQLTMRPREIPLIGGGKRTFTSWDNKLYGGDAGEVEISGSRVADWFEIVPAQIAGGDGWVTIGLKEGRRVWIREAVTKGSGADAKIEAGALVEVTDDVASLIYALLDPVRAFTDGRMYYAIPVLHEKQFDANGRFDASPQTLKIGDIGVVRNHWYRLTVGSVSSLGTSVHDPDQPIIPNHEPEYKSLGIQFEILPWSVLTLDDVIL